MDKYYQFNEDEIENIIKRFGKEFYEKVLENIKVYSDKWNLTSFKFIKSYSANLVFMCHSANYGEAVLKIGKASCREISTEANALSQYNGRRFCRIFETDIENGIILEERVQPGNTLRKESSIDKRLAVFSSLYKGLHIAPIKEELYPTYIGWVSRITEYMSKREDCKELYLYMKKARDICLAVSNLYPQKLLLHGDFHHDNILLGNNGEYKIIDPKGVIGDPVFDVPRFILNEFEDEITDELYKKINYIIYILEKELDIPEHILRQCLFVETAMGICWRVEDGSSSEENQKLIKTVAFAEKIMNTSL